MEHSVERLSEIAVNCGYKLHVDLGPGLLESVYEALMANALAGHGLQVDRQKPVRIEHDGIILREGFRADIVVGNKLLIELKSTERHMPVHAKQVLTYLRLMQLPLGLLMNFGAPTFKEGCKRIVNNHSDFASSRLRVNQTEQGDPDDQSCRHGTFCQDNGY
ncbi:GxxExxY protein [Parasphingorhabdus marina DSM 22363]|uniref:GxxExxY protein n=1 Tax=Parasphingorhabdus marina DSM 22363 TaxID=1123272 RepID=A0A1N6CLY0_9SPHN|nr:GxxExxY protein [Parasphingorhabdus marina]SIN59583.1 GxxExxY protein [Parasphingorhabdus marina DSM 22363]